MSRTSADTSTTVVRLQHAQFKIIEKQKFHWILPGNLFAQLLRGNFQLPAILAHRPAIQAGEIFAEQDHAHRHRATHAILALLGGRVAFEKFLRHAAVAFFVFGNAPIGLFDPLGHVRRFETHLNQIIGDGFARQRKPAMRSQVSLSPSIALNMAICAGKGL